MVKKIILFAATLIPLFFAVVAQSELLITNNTNPWSGGAKYASLMISSNNNLCSGAFPRGIINPSSTTKMTANDVRTFCGTTIPCHANVIISNSTDNAKYCAGGMIGTLILNDFSTDDTDIIAYVLNIPGSGYTITGEKTNQISINPK